MQGHLSCSKNCNTSVQASSIVTTELTHQSSFENRVLGFYVGLPPSTHPDAMAMPHMLCNLSILVSHAKLLGISKHSGNSLSRRATLQDQMANTIPMQQQPWYPYEFVNHERISQSGMLCGTRSHRKGIRKSALQSNLNLLSRQNMPSSNLIDQIHALNQDVSFDHPGQLGPALRFVT